ncbi:MAG: SusE domain-containing protein [Saprospiraceae bacterium]|nr:SusE domain-containing protein [Saprospiraceae bacterium]MDW8485278.1 SusE domain-containing protein [Saprospiraceae bacterium]
MNTKLFLPMTALLLLFVGGCEKQGEFDPSPALRLRARPVITAPTSGSNIVLRESQASNSFTVSWTPADFNFRAAATYAVEIDRAGNKFKDAVVLGTSTGTSLTTTVEKLNTALFSALGLPGEEASNVEMRVAVTIHPNVDVVYSDPIALRVTPYTIVIVYPQLQVPGSYQGWNPADNTTVIYSAKSNNRYEGYIYFKDDNTEYKYTVGPSWAENYGDNGGDGTLERDGANIKAGPAGVYRLRVNLNDKTHDNLRTVWGLIGSATPNGWNSDQDMTYDVAANKWTITLNLVAGEIKFRANDSWDVNLGDDGLNKSLEYNGANIPIASPGNYTIDLFLNKAIYTYTIKKN